MTIRQEEHANDILSGYISRKEEEAMQGPWKPAYEENLNALMRRSSQSDEQKAVKFLAQRARQKGANPKLAVRYGEYNVKKQKLRMLGIQQRSNKRHEQKVARSFKRLGSRSTA